MRIGPGRSVLLFIAIGTVLCAWQPRAQTPSRRSDVIVPAAPALVLQSGLTDSAAFDLLQRLLTEAAVPFGLESAASGPMEMGALVQGIERAPLNGLRLGEALDAIVRMHPRFRWSEVNGSIVVRAIEDGGGLLDRRVPRFAITSASPRAALDALVLALDPKAPNVSVPSPLGPGGAGASIAARKGRDITMSVSDASVLQILNGMAAADGALSWVVRYTGFPPSFDNARITLIESGQAVTAESPAVLRGTPSAPPGDHLRVSAAELEVYLRTLAQEVPVQFGLELAGLASRVSGTPRVFRTLDIPRAAAGGIRTIVETDPRYEWSESDGLFHITPKAGTPGRVEALNQVVPSFEVHDVPIAQAFDRIIWMLGGQPGVNARYFRGDAPELKPVSLTVLHPATIRELLDALCRAHGTASWQAQNGAQPGSTEWTLLDAKNRWTVTRAFYGPPPVALPRRPGTSGSNTPAGGDASAKSTRIALFDQALPGVSASNEPLAQLLDRIIWLMHVQPGLGGRTLSADAPEVAPVSLSISPGTTFRAALDALCRAQGALTWGVEQQALESQDIDLTLTSPGGWRVSRRLYVPLEMVATQARVPAHPPAVPVPASLDHQIPRVQVFIGGDLDRSFATLAAEAHAPMGIEMLPNRPVNPDPRVVRQGPPPPPLIVGPGTFSDALYVLLDRQSDYELSVADNVLDVAPKSVSQKPGHFLDVPIDRFDVKDVSVSQAVRVLRHLMNPAFSDAPVTGYGGSVGGLSPQDAQQRMAEANSLFKRPVTLSLEHATPRQILNRLVSLHGELFWIAEYRGRSMSEAADLVETDCTIFLSTFANVGIRTQFEPVRPRVSVTTPQTTPMVDARTMLVPGGRRVLVRLPADVIELGGAVRQWARAAQVPVGIETIAGPRSSGAASQNQSLYDISGLPIPVVLDKLLASMPDYEWRKDGEIYHVRPKAIVSNTGSVLARPVDQFVHDLASPWDAMAEVLGLVARRPVRSARSPVQPPTFAPFTDKPMAINLSNVTVRDVLDAIVRAGNGALLWSVEYKDETAGAAGLRVGLDNLKGPGSVNLSSGPG